MPTTRVRRRRYLQLQVSNVQWALLRDEPVPDAGLVGDFEQWGFQCDDPSEMSPWRTKTGRALWREYGRAVLVEWIAANPGSRPSAWWRFDAPREPVGARPGWFDDGKLPLLRQRIGGVGEPKFGPANSWCGLPATWFTAADVERDPALLGRAIDFTNPPTFESQANFLDRHGLLLPTERRRLQLVDFQPERVTDVFNLGSL